MNKKNNQKKIIVIFFIIMFFLSGLVYLFFWRQNVEKSLTLEIDTGINAEKDWVTKKGNPDVIELFYPQRNDFLKSPFVIKGQARGFWFFEASFPVKLLDANGDEILLDPTYIMTENDWMTEDFVSFEAVLEFSEPKTETGTLVLEKNNPSGISEYDDYLEVPVRFLMEEKTNSD